MSPTSTWKKMVGYSWQKANAKWASCCINSSKMVEVHEKLLNKRKLLSAEAIIYDHTTPHHITSFLLQFWPILYVYPSTLLQLFFPQVNADTLNLDFSVCPLSFNH